MLQDIQGRVFCCGQMEGRIRPDYDSKSSLRLFITIEIEGIPLEAAVDTGGSFVIIHPEIAQQFELKRAIFIKPHKIIIQGLPFAGSLYDLPIIFRASQGESLEIHAQVFVPEPDQHGWGDLPSFVGLFGCLERMKFAVDPAEPSYFYFGPT